MAKITPPPRHASLRSCAVWIVRVLRGAGHQALFAGGCVRDLLMRRKAADYDIATDAHPERVIELFPRTRSVGRAFGVILVGVHRHWIEAATFRSDITYSDGRHPDAVRFSTPREDARRRDFTINGMFYDPIGRKVIDFVGGRRDLERRLIRAIGDPEHRFAEDHLRLLRAVRFAARLAYRIERDTLRAIKHHAASLRRVSPERIRDELERMLVHAARVAAWDLLIETGLAAHLWKGSSNLVERRAVISRVLAAVPRTTSFNLAMAILALPDPFEAERVCDVLRMSNDRKKSITWLVAHHADLDHPERVSLADLKLLMAGPAFADLLVLLRARLIAEHGSQSPWRQARARACAIPADQVSPPPLLTGHDLLALKIPPGPVFRKVLDRAYYAQLNGDIRDRAAARALARQLTSADRALTIRGSENQGVADDEPESDAR